MSSPGYVDANGKFVEGTGSYAPGGGTDLPPVGYYWYFDSSAPGGKRALPLPGNVAKGVAAVRTFRDSTLMSRGTGMGHPDYETGQETLGRQQQADSLGMLKAQALGQGPSVAAGQQAMATGQAINSANAGAQAGNNPLAARAAMLGGSQGMMHAAVQGAAGRAQEQNAGMQSYGQGSTDLRGSDLAMRQQWLQQAQRDRQMQLQNASQNVSAVQGWNSLDADAQSRLRNANNTAMNDWQTGMDRYKQGQQDVANTAMATGVTLLGVGSDARVKTNVRKGGK